MAWLVRAMVTGNRYYARWVHRGEAEGSFMAKQIVTLLTDDLDGGEADRTVELGLDGVNYTIDLSEKNAGKLRKALDPSLSRASRVGRTPVSGRLGSRNGGASARS